MEKKKQKFWGKDKGKKEEPVVHTEKYKHVDEHEKVEAKFEPQVREWLEKHFDLFIDFKTEQTRQSKTGFSIAIEKVVGRFSEKLNFDTYCEKLPKGMESKLSMAQEEFFSIPKINEHNVRSLVERICTELVRTRQSETKHELKAEAKKKDTVVISLDPKVRKQLGMTGKEIEHD